MASGQELEPGDGPSTPPPNWDHPEQNRREHRRYDVLVPASVRLLDLSSNQITPTIYGVIVDASLWGFRVRVGGDSRSFTHLKPGSIHALLEFVPPRLSAIAGIQECEFRWARDSKDDPHAWEIGLRLRTGDETLAQRIFNATKHYEEPHLHPGHQRAKAAVIASTFVLLSLYAIFITGSQNSLERQVDAVHNQYIGTTRIVEQLSEALERAESKVARLELEALEHQQALQQRRKDREAWQRFLNPATTGKAGAPGQGSQNAGGGQTATQGTQGTQSTQDGTTEGSAAPGNANHNQPQGQAESSAGNGPQPATENKDGAPARDAGETDQTSNTEDSNTPEANEHDEPNSLDGTSAEEGADVDDETLPDHNDDSADDHGEGEDHGEGSGEIEGDDADEQHGESNEEEALEAHLAPSEDAPRKDAAD